MTTLSHGDSAPLGAAEICRLLEQHWTPPGVHLSDQPLDPETMAAIIRMMGGEFRWLSRLLTQMERIIEVNALQEVTKAVVEAARESLVIGEPWTLFPVYPYYVRNAGIWSRWSCTSSSAVPARGQFRAR